MQLDFLLYFWNDWRFIFCGLFLFLFIFILSSFLSLFLFQLYSYLWFSFFPWVLSLFLPWTLLFPFSFFLSFCSLSMTDWHWNMSDHMTSWLIDWERIHFFRAWLYADEKGNRIEARCSATPKLISIKATANLLFCVFADESSISLPDIYHLNKGQKH